LASWRWSATWRDEGCCLARALSFRVNGPYRT